jgi:hypothetical protein
VPATGRAVSTQEFAIYRFQAGRIAEVWVTADNLRLLDQLLPAVDPAVRNASETGWPNWPVIP